MNHNEEKRARLASLERRHRARIAAGLRAAGQTYRQIGATLGISLAQVERLLGEATALRAAGLTKREVADEIGVAYGSLGRVLGTPRRAGVSARQNQALAGLADMHGMQVDVLAWFLGTPLSSAYDLANSLIDSGKVQPLVSAQRGRGWVVPTRDTAAQYLGWRPAAWTPKTMFAEHYRCVAQARIMLVGADPTLWVSERTLRRRALTAAGEGRQRGRGIEVSTSRDPRRGRTHVHDGRFLGAVGAHRGWWALEVELSVKSPAAHMDLALQGAFRAALTSEDEPVIGLLYLCRSARVLDLVQAAYKRLPPELRDSRLLWATGDFDDEWSKHLLSRRRTDSARRLASTRTDFTQEAS